ncbi:hypothetical protein LCGC14_1322890 [marine sediment metagenome]|uniref:Uncharacterized protein n=1 Tax=marine sediment metagenome TaxID=412755 RepID=A0A0F9MZS1_9ZZZZ
MAANYKVLKIDELTRVGDAGTLIKVYRHSIKTKGKTILTVDISQEDFTAEKAAPILEKAAVDADKILAL